MLDEINFIIYLTIAISGTVFGSFFTLAVHRIPRHEDITHVRSYCPKCNHKLHFWELIHVWSYIFLGGKCRYCKEKIRPRYLILEICSGIIFVLLALAHGINFESSLEEWLFFGINILFIVSMFITAGIDKELYKIIDGVMLYGAIIGIIRLCFLTYFGNNIMTYFYSFLIWSVAFLLICIISKYANKDEEKEWLQYVKGIIKYLAILGLAFGLKIQLFGILFTLFASLIYKLILRISNKQIKIPVGFLITVVFMCVFVCMGICT